jgi:hypothetical protein
VLSLELKFLISGRDHGVKGIIDNKKIQSGESGRKKQMFQVRFVAVSKNER